MGNREEDKKVSISYRTDPISSVCAANEVPTLIAGTNFDTSVLHVVMFALYTGDDDDDDEDDDDGCPVTETSNERLGWTDQTDGPPALTTSGHCCVGSDRNLISYNGVESGESRKK